jgi:pyruvate ferredoxin oxidoreductase delta subunit
MAKQTEIPIGVVARPGSSIANKTGSIRVQRPEFKKEKCSGCRMCAYVCPEGCVFGEGKLTFDAQLEYCKGCGLCAAVCPVHDIEMIVER